MVGDDGDVAGDDEPEDAVVELSETTGLVVDGVDGDVSWTTC